MKNIGLRLLSIILSASILLSTMSTAVFAAEKSIPQGYKIHRSRKAVLSLYS